MVLSVLVDLSAKFLSQSTVKVPLYAHHKIILHSIIISTGDIFLCPEPSLPSHLQVGKGPTSALHVLYGFPSAVPIHSVKLAPLNSRNVCAPHPG